MPFSLTIRTEVLEELDDIETWYEKKSEGLSEKFHRDYEDTLDRILVQPLLFPFVFDEIRRLDFKKFPYAILYAVQDQSVIILRVIHQRRDPRLWQIKFNGKDTH